MKLRRASFLLDGLLILALGLINAVVLLSSRLSLVWRPETVILAAATFLAALGWFYGCYRKIPRLARMAVSGCILILFTDMAALFNYFMYALFPQPLWDSRFDALDRALGLDWLACYGWVLAHPWLQWISGGIYGLLGLELILLLLLLEMLGQHRQAVELRHNFCLSALATILIGLVMPASGPFVFYHLPVAAQTPYVAQFAGLHDGTLRRVNLSNVQGLIIFPSFHATLSVLCAYAARALRFFAWPALILNILIISTAIVEGGHYFTDIFAGFFLAVIVIAARRYAGMKLGGEAQLASTALAMPGESA